MAGRLSFDTSFLIDFQRERLAGGDGPAHRLLDSDHARELFLPTVALGEFAEGFDDPDDPILRTVRETHVLLPADEKAALAYGGLVRELRARGSLIGSNDLWIAATALRYDLPLATGDVTHFQRIPRLRIIGYRAS